MLLFSLDSPFTNWTRCPVEEEETKRERGGKKRRELGFLEGNRDGRFLKINFQCQLELNFFSGLEGLSSLYTSDYFFYKLNSI
jgi:hypothetical protein